MVMGVDLINAILPALVCASVIGYIRLAFATVRKDMAGVAKDIKVSTQRIESAIEKLEDRIETHDGRLHAVEVSQAKREGREEAIAQFKATG